MNFEELKINPWLCRALNSISISKPTEVQKNCIPEALKGKDIIASAATGSGKTIAFALPILQELGLDPFGVFALVISPTRELCFQIAEQFRLLGNDLALKVAVIVGGMDMLQQAVELAKKPHIVVCTPGRLHDHINSSANAIHFKRIKYLVLDEADRLLEDSFSANLKVILAQLPKNKQTFLLSATMTDSIKALRFRTDVEPFIYSVTESFELVEQLDQQYLFIPSSVRDVYLCYLLLNDLKGKSCIIFTSKPKTCEIIRILLREMDLKSTCLHSQMSQNDRIGSLAKFKSGIISILISTDVGSRGLDIPAVEVVLNLEIPADPADYVHRIGRTARAGRDGLSLSFITERDVDIILEIEEKIKKKLVEYPVQENAVLELLNAVNMGKRQASMELSDSEFGAKKLIQKEKGTYYKVGKKTKA